MARLLLASLLACAPIEPSVPPPPEKREPEVLKKPAPAAKRPWACTTDAECPADPRLPEARPICESGRCERWDAARLWSWAAEVAPELAKLEPAIGLDGVDWIHDGDRIRLHVDATKLIWKGRPRCVAIDFEATDGALVAQVPEVFGAKPNAPGVWFYRLELRGLATLLGPSRTTKGGGGEAIGGFSDVGGHLIATPRGLGYTGRNFSVELACKSFRHERPGCDPPVCERCDEIAIARTFTAPFGGRESGPPSITLRSEGTCEPCEPDRLGPLLPRLRETVQGRVFVDDREPRDGPTFYRSRTDCVTATRRRGR